MFFIVIPLLKGEMWDNLVVKLHNNILHGLIPNTVSAYEVALLSQRIKEGWLGVQGCLCAFYSRVKLGNTTLTNRLTELDHCSS